jgi:hypothetical protein
MGGTGGPARIEELHRQWHRFGRVGSDKKDGLGFAMSVNGNGSPRSIPNARFAAVAAEDIQKCPL